MVAPPVKNAVKKAAKVVALRTVARKLAPPKRSQAVLVVVIGGGLILLLGLMTIVAAVLALFAPLSQEDPNAANLNCAPGLAGVSGSGAAGTAGAAPIDQLSQEQLDNAETIVATGKRLNVPEYGWVIAVATASQESTLRNLDYGDRDSIGLFQQRNAWGSRADRLDPAKSTAMFFNGGAAGQNGLLDIQGWERMTVAEAAQAVQVSAFPTAYADDEPLARQLVARFGGTDVLDGCSGGPTVNCPTTSYGWEDALTPDALLVLRCTHQRYPQFKTFYGPGQRPAGGDGDHAAGRAIDMMIPGNYSSSSSKSFGWGVANWLRTNHATYGVKYIIYDAKIWSVRRTKEGWRPYSNYTGCTTDNCMHRNHIHVSVYGNAASLPDTGDWALPVEKGRYNLTARFGACSGHWENCHTGLDFAAPTGTPILAASAGRVVAVNRSGGPYGNFVQIDHGNGIVTMYAHMNGFSTQTGRVVQPGMMIGEVGSTGNTTGPHLHFEVRDGGEPVDPEVWLKAHGLTP